MASNKYLTENVNMNQNEEVPDFLGGHGDLLPADVLKMVNELLEQLHRKERTAGATAPERQRSPRRHRIKHLRKRQSPCGSCGYAEFLWRRMSQSADPPRPSLCREGERKRRHTHPTPFVMHRTGDDAVAEGAAGRLRG